MGEQLDLLGFEGGKAAPMDGRGTEALEGIEMFRGGVTLVQGESVARIKLVELDHQTVAGDFGEDARGGDRGTEGVALDHCGLGAVEQRRGESVEEDMLRRGIQSVKSATHGFVGGAEDVDGIDGLSIEADDCPVQIGVIGELGEKALTVGGGKLFGIVQATEWGGEAIGQPGHRENHRSGGDWAGEWAAAGFVDAGDAVDAVSHEVAFEEQAVGRRRWSMPGHGGDGCGWGDDMPSEMRRCKRVYGRSQRAELQK
jgi:hypothetical protein